MSSRTCSPAILSVLFSAVALATSGSLVAQTIVYDNNTIFTNTGTSNQGQAVEKDWYYNNVRNSGEVGVTDTYARSGAGSAYLATINGPGGASSKADIEYLASAVAVSGNYFSSASLGTLGSLVGLSYDWYRDSASTANANQHAVIRILVDADGNLATTGDRGGLVFEQVYNGSPVSVATDTWVTDDIFSYNSGNGAKLWSFGAGMAFAEFGYGNTLNDWKNGVGTINSNSAVLGFSAGVGSGWGPYFGAVDNIGFDFGSGMQSFNFEPIPEPGAMAVLGLVALAGLARTRRRS